GRDLSGAVTVSLNIDYAATARAGQWLQVEPRLIRAGGAMGFVDALVTAEDQVAARASATFRAVSPRG
ncbi:MAG: hotdog domain-containing protein, partial [Pseudomonadota bacterium]